MIHLTLNITINARRQSQCPDDMLMINLAGSCRDLQRGARRHRRLLRGSDASAKGTTLGTATCRSVSRGSLLLARVQICFCIQRESTDTAACTSWIPCSTLREIPPLVKLDAVRGGSVRDSARDCDEAHWRWGIALQIDQAEIMRLSILFNLWKMSVMSEIRVVMECIRSWKNINCV